MKQYQVKKKLEKRANETSRQNLTLRLQKRLYLKMKVYAHNIDVPLNTLFVMAVEEFLK